jgi:hypothetical protein
MSCEQGRDSFEGLGIDERMGLKWVIKGRI